MRLPELDQAPELTALERSVLDIALVGDDESLAAMRSQAARAESVSRTPSGVGFMTKLRVPEEIPAAGERGQVPAVYGEHPELPSGAEFLVQIRNGRIHCIEAFCYEGIWPAKESLFRLRR